MRLAGNPNDEEWNLPSDVNHNFETDPVVNKM
jgi:hypothetical protein